MLDYLHHHEALIRLICFALVFAVFATWEGLRPRRVRRYSKGVRWLNNLGIVLLDVLVVRLAVPLTVVAVAAVAQQQNLGLLHSLQMPA